MFIFGEELEKMESRLEKVFGIHEIIIGYEFDTVDIEEHPSSNNLLYTISKEYKNLFKSSKLVKWESDMRSEVLALFSSP